MGEKEDDIFTDDYPKNLEKKSEDKIENSESTPPPKNEEEDDWSIPDRDPQTETKNSKKLIGVGAIVVGVIIVLAFFAVYGLTDSEPFDSSQCNFGVKSSFMSTRCMTQEEYNESQVPEGIEISIEEEPIQNIPTVDDKPFEDVSTATDIVEVEKTKDTIGYFMVTTDDDWYGDFVDFRKVPSKIEKNGSLQVNFRCFVDEFQGTSTYFGTFRNVVQSDLSVKVFIGGVEVDSQSTNSNKALILEGSCYSHEPAKTTERIIVETVSPDLPDVVTINTTGN